MLELESYGSRIISSDASTKDVLRNGFYGVLKKDKLFLTPEEALYLLDVRNAVCKRNGEETQMSEVAERFWMSKKFIARYLTYKDWRDRGLVAIPTDRKYAEPDQNPVKTYPSSSLSLPKFKVNGIFFKADMVTIITDDEEGRSLYDNFWLGQYGSYKASERGKLNKLDVYEALFLMEKGVLSLKNIDEKQLVSQASRGRKEFKSLYAVYKDWRDKGYVIKTGFKFGTHFRAYFPGAKPGKSGNGEWAHSKHVIHVFPKSSRLLISEWARAIRVAHSVRKTFILAVPGKMGKERKAIDFILYHRHGGEADNPELAAPKFAMLSLSEEEYIGGQELASAINEAKKRRLQLLLAIADRETSVTYYKVTQIRLHNGAENEYYEIDWFQP